MNRKGFILILCALVLLGSTLLLSRSAPGGSPSPRQVSAQKDYTVPEHVIYGFLFSKVSRISEKTRELRAKSQIAQKPYFPLQSEASLSEGQATALEAIASACQKEVALLDEKARVIINAFQTKFPGGKVPEGGAPPPPPELKIMWEQRNAIILRARDQLRAAFGEETFARFDNYAKFHYGANTAPALINPVRPKAK